MVRATSVDAPGYIRRERVRVRADKQVDMIGPDCQFNHRPFVLCRYFPDDLLQASMYVADKDLAP
jgi:hypothetical protein